MKDQLVSIRVLRALAALAVVVFHLSVSWREDFGLTSQPLPMLLAFRRWPKALTALPPVGVALILAQNNIEPGWPREIEVGLPALMIVGGVLGGSTPSTPCTELSPALETRRIGSFGQPPRDQNLDPDRNCAPWRDSSFRRPRLRRSGADQNSVGAGELHPARMPLQRLVTAQILKKKRPVTSKPARAGMIPRRSASKSPSVLDARHSGN